MSAPWPPPCREPDPRQVAEALAALRRVNRRLDAAERRMAELEHGGGPSLAASAWRGFQAGFAAVLIMLLLLLA